MISSQNVELADVLILLDRLCLNYQLKVEDCECIVLITAQKYVHFEVVFDLNQPYVPTQQ